MEEAGRRLGGGRRGHRLHLDRQDRHRRRGARGRPAAGDPRRRRGDGRRRHRARADRDRRQAGRGALVRGDEPGRGDERGRSGDGGGRRRRGAPGRHRRAGTRTAPLRRARHSGPAGGATRPWSCGSPPSTTSTSRASRGPAAAAGCASRTCSHTSRTAARRKSRRCTSSRRTSPTQPAAPKKRQPRFTRDGEAAPAAAPAPAAAAASSGPLSRMRQSIGRAMVESLQTAATCTTIVEADMTRVDAARKALGVTYLPVIARATIETLREFPSLNATLEGETFTTYEGVHLGIAVSLGEGGLIVPVIRDAQELSVEGLGEPDQGPRQAGARERAHPRRGARRLVHDHEPRRLRLDHRDAGDQPAAGGDPRHRGGRQAAGRGDRRARATTRSRSGT